MLAAAGRLLFLVVVIAPVGAWSSLALWFRAPAPEWLRLALAACFALLALGAAFFLLVRKRWRPLAGLGVVFLGLLAWWSTIAPPGSANFAPDVARQTTGKLDGDLLTLTDIRDFDWRSDADFTERWTSKTYDLTKLRTLDLFLSYWDGPRMAHVITSFGFEDGEQIAWSIEVKRLKGGEFSPLADLFKTDPLAIVAATERDVVRVRSNVRGEDVQMYRLDVYPETMRALLMIYVQDANALAKEPRFYNSLTTNCTTTVAGLVKAIGKPVPLDWRLVINGYLPDYLHENDALSKKAPLDELKRLAHIAERAKAANDAPDFSQRIRVGVPGS
ncbi:MAG: DUF4105 domain-containing protein [Methylobacteriaceae bacterium]|nr:DUF4105 domain-containing protein [Rhodoblastus sp.]MCC0005741.1 DUF4105 domain-containing protein [Methylobacteriaceae bacterium]